MAVLWGIVYTTSLHSRALGICMGLMMGAAFGLFDSDQEENDDSDEE